MEYTIGSKVFDGWEITQLLGEGSYGKVFLIEKTDFGFTAKAAMKLIRIPKSPSEIREALSEGMDEKSVTTYFEEIVERFVREIAVMSQLKGHPNVVSCENYRVEPHEGSIGWDILIKMELLTSLPVYQMEHPMQEANVSLLAEHICRALVYIQNRGMIHRDIKPANIFVDHLGQFKLGDFGVARTAEQTLGGMSKQGTENYMAPEVYHGKPYGVSVDIYSLGLVLYRLMNGNRLPFYLPEPHFNSLADRENALIRRMKGDPLPPPRDASPEFTAVILKACAHAPGDRYQTAAEMLEDLLKIKGTPVERLSFDNIMHSSPANEGAVDPVRERIQTAPPSEEDEGTVNIFAGKAKAAPADAGEDRTLNIFSDRKKAAAPDDVEDKTVNIFGNRKISDFPKDEPKPEPAGPTRREGMLEFWKKNLRSLWREWPTSLKTMFGSSGKLGSWQAYFAPDLPLQICSNAIFNITRSEVRKDQVLAILDCTFDSRIPCGRGIVVTEDKMYINLLAENGNEKKFPPAVLEFDRNKRIWNSHMKGFMGVKYPILEWETTDGTVHCFGKNMSLFVDYGALEKLLNRPEWKACLRNKK